MTRADLAARLGVSVSALRKWEETYSSLLVTPKGQKGEGQAKAYDPHDVRVLTLVRRMRQEGLTADQVLDQLPGRLATATDEVTDSLPLVPDQPRQVSVQDYADLYGRFRATEGQLTSLSDERDYLRQRVADIEDRLVAAQERAAAAEAQLDLLRRLGLVSPDAVRPADETATSETPHRSSWLDRLRGK